MTEKKNYENHRFVGSTWVVAPPNSIHNVRSTAETRATNRAIANLVAAGEVSAEEMDQGNVGDRYHSPDAPSTHSTATPPPTQPKQPVTNIGPDEMSCPTCGKMMYDNRYVHDGGKGRFHKSKDTQPDWKCSDKTCNYASCYA